MKKVVALKDFADKNNFSKRYKVGEELTGFDEKRIENLVKRGLVKCEGEPATVSSGKTPKLTNVQ